MTGLENANHSQRLQNCVADVKDSTGRHVNICSCMQGDGTQPPWHAAQ